MGCGCSNPRRNICPQLRAGRSSGKNKSPTRGSSETKGMGTLPGGCAGDSEGVAGGRHHLEGVFLRRESGGCAAGVALGASWGCRAWGGGARAAPCSQVPRPAPALTVWLDHFCLMG